MFLETIVRDRQESIKRRRQARPLSEVEGLVRGLTDPPRSLRAALSKPGVSLIAEAKKASPSKGLLAPEYDPARLAIRYEAAGASAISVLTEPSSFMGDLEHLREVRAVSGLPVLQKDFVVEPYQIYEGRAWGADAVLLIAALHSEADLRALLEVAGDLGMDALVEVHDDEELSRALKVGADLIGINNRDLKTFRCDLSVTLELAPLAKGSGRVVVSESALASRQDVERVAKAGVDAILVGEALVTAPDPGEKIRELLGKGND